MVFTFARISVACGLNVGDIFHQQRRLWLRLHEKGGKFHEMPCHHTLEGYLTEYVEHTRLSEAGRIPLFQAIKYRPYGRGPAELTGFPPDQRLEDGAATGQGGRHHHRSVQPHLPGHRHHRLP